MVRLLRMTAGIAALSIGTASIIVAGCLDRPVTDSAPTTSTTFTSALSQTAIDKVDLLFVIDNSASMGDKQQYLIQAVPDLIKRLVTPNCILNGAITGQSDASGNCTTGTVEFPPVHDLHIGLLSSSLGERLGNTYQQGSSQTSICLPSEMIQVGTGGSALMLNNHNDDRGELINRGTAAETTLPDLGTSNYLNYFPNVAANMGKTASAGAPVIPTSTQLEADFTSMIQGIGTYGCGIESQLESWYRFLVQPDPYASLANGANGVPPATWVGVDSTILQQRQNFLRPDSLVAIIDMTDENDSEVDVRALNGQGYLWMNSNFDPPPGLSACAENSTNSGLTDFTNCNTCNGNKSDPMCATGDYSNGNDWGYNLNLRHVHEKQKYGILPQFPIQRYVLGLTSQKVPDRTGEYPSGAQSYQGLSNLNCTNPLFAASLPDGSNTDAATLCNLTPGTRPASLIYYAHIGGVPHQLLQTVPGESADAGGGATCPTGTAAADCPQKDVLAASDWQKILGNIPQAFGNSSTDNAQNNPEAYDYTGIDPHMIESYEPRTGTGISPPPTAPVTGTLPDPISGYDWVTNMGSEHILAVDREYACTFPLATPRDCSNTSDPSIGYTCDCPQTAGLTPQEVPPLCNQTTTTTQDYAKAYPTIRELLLANLLGGQGIISSLCPIHVTPANNDMPEDPVYGYRPAITAIVDRLAGSLAAQCLPEALKVQEGGTVECLILVTLPNGTQATACDTAQGLSQPDPAILARFLATQGGDAGNNPVCQLNELTQASNPGDFASNGSCAGSKDPGWCYVTGSAAGTCPQALLFSNGSPPSGSHVSLQCLEESVGQVTLDGGSD